MLDWSRSNSELAIGLYEELRKTNVELPLLVVDWSEGGEPVREQYARTDQRIRVLTEADLGDPNAVAAALESVGVPLPLARVQVDPGAGGLVLEGLLRWLGPENLQLIIQKFFPDAIHAQVEPVGGGWSDAKLLRVLVRGEPAPYFLKFFTDGDAYRREWERHERARAWLAEAAVPLRHVPNLGGGAPNQLQAFPPMEPCVFPVCYESASTKDRPHETLKDFYRTAQKTNLERAIRRLADILSKDQPLEPAEQDPDEPPWADSGEDCFRLTPTTKERLLNTLDDLSLYGAGIFASDFEVRWRELEGFLYMPLPRWLVDWRPVLRGHVHGDPNPRNCLVSKDDPKDLVLIDCGAYRPNGRLVSDLAIVERDIKLLMMGLEHDARDFFDLDVGQLRDWCQAERTAIRAGLKYTSPPVAAAGGRYASAPRAYRLVGIVRREAKRVCGTWDREGNHYFAALLFRTLEILEYPAVRRAKKLLALYSASEILQAFRSPASP